MCPPDPQSTDPLVNEAIAGLVDSLRDMKGVAKELGIHRHSKWIALNLRIQKSIERAQSFVAADTLRLIDGTKEII